MIESVKKNVGTFALLAAVALAIYAGAEIGLNFSPDVPQQIERLWQEDIAQLITAGSLHSGWDSIRSIEKMPGNDDRHAEGWLNSLAIPITINPSGKYILQIIVVSQKDENGIRAVIQHHLREYETGNSIWELGRTYNLEQ